MIVRFLSRLPPAVIALELAFAFSVFLSGTAFALDVGYAVLVRSLIDSAAQDAGDPASTAAAGDRSKAIEARVLWGAGPHVAHDRLTVARRPPDIAAPAGRDAVYDIRYRHVFFTGLALCQPHDLARCPLSVDLTTRVDLRRGLL